MIRRIDLPTLSTSSFPYSHIVMDGRYAFLSGVVASDVPGGQRHSGDVAEETRIVLGAIRDALASVGLAMDRIVRVDVHMTDLDRMPELNAAYREFFPEGGLPARTCTQSARLAGGSSVEITVVASLEA
jgi:2-iminobutanoate/2-iminopropanoate deaminase